MLITSSVVSIVTIVQGVEPVNNWNKIDKLKGTRIRRHLSIDYHPNPAKERKREEKREKEGKWQSKSKSIKFLAPFTNLRSTWLIFPTTIRLFTVHAPSISLSLRNYHATTTTRYSRKRLKPGLEKHGRGLIPRDKTATKDQCRSFFMVKGRLEGEARSVSTGETRYRGLLGVAGFSGAG